MKVALVSREVAPFGGGRIGRCLTDLARTLSPIGEITIITADVHRDRYEELRPADSAQRPYSDARVVFLPTPVPGELGNYCHAAHVWSARVYQAICELYPGGGPDIAEFPDFEGEACVTIQARRTHDPRLRDTRVCVRLDMTHEIAAVLNGALPADQNARTVFDLERYSLKYADQLLCAGGDVLGTYRRFYGPNALAEARVVRPPFIGIGTAGVEAPVSARETLRLLYAGPLERRRGVESLIEAAIALDGDDWSLTLVGPDTTSGSLGVSVRDKLMLAAAGDRRIQFGGDGSARRLGTMIDDSHAVIVPSRWECWPSTALEALHANRPVVATPTGGLEEIVVEGRSGWLTSDATTGALSARLEALLAEPEAVDSLIASGTARAHLASLADPKRIRDAYAALVARDHPTPRPPSSVTREPLVSAVVTYFELETFVEATIESVLAQTYGAIEVIIVNDGSFRDQDRILGELTMRHPVQVISQPNGGVSAARNLGVALARGRYVFTIDADNVARPEFVERAVRVLEAEPGVAYVTCWVAFVDESGEPIVDALGPAGGYPISNDTLALDHQNTAGDATAVFRRAIFDHGFSYDTEMTSYEDWLLYRDLRDAGQVGHVIPEPLLAYRVRADSKSRTVGERHHEHILLEMEAHSRREQIEWTSAAARLSNR